MSKQFRLSSNWTLVLKVFFPTFWIVFFGLLTLSLFIADPEDNLFPGNVTAKLIFTAIFLVFLLVLFLTVMSLKRVDADEEYIYVSNYFKTYRYKLQDIKAVKEIDFGLALILRSELHQKGAFGKKFSYLLNKATFDDYLLHYPECHEYFPTQ